MNNRTMIDYCENRITRATNSEYALMWWTLMCAAIAEYYNQLSHDIHKKRRG